MNAAISYINFVKNSAYDKWHTAFVYLVKKEKRGIQTQLAKKTNTSNRHISDVVVGKRGASQPLQEELAKALGRTYEQMLKIGSGIIGEAVEEPFENYNEIMCLPILDRAWAILRQAAEVHGVTGYLSAVGGSKKPKFAEKFLAGEQNEVELYEESLDRFAEVVRKIKQAMKEQGIE